MVSFLKVGRIAATAAACIASVAAQSFLTAISQYPQLSNFTTLMIDNPGLAGALLTSNASSLTRMTVLVPDNSAFDKLQVLLGKPVGTLTVEQLEPILQYHLLVDELKTANFAVPNGTTRPTFLTGPMYNNRSAGAALGSSGANGDPRNGQVVFIQAKDASTTSARFTVRQLSNPSSDIVQGGLGHKVNMTAVDGHWDGGVFQIVDQFLDLPLNCTESIRRWKMTAFRGSLDRTGLGSPLDVTQNVTCFTPNDDAFLRAGSPNVTASIFDLQQLTLFHLITEPLYTNFLADGQEYTTFNNKTVRITIRDGSYFVNDAKLITTNVMTNNGLMHVIDRIMSPLEASQTSSTTTSLTATATQSGSSSTPATPSAIKSGGAAQLDARGSTSRWLSLAALIYGFLV